VMERNSGLGTLPQQWVWTTLGETVQYVKGKRPKILGSTQQGLSVPYITIEAFEKGVFAQYTDCEDCRLCHEDDVLMVWDGARCGLVGTGVSGAVGSTLAKLVSHELDSSYLFRFLQLQYEHINGNPRGVGIPHVDPDVLRSIPFPLAPLPEQQRIAAKIEELFCQLDAGVATLEKAAARLQRYSQSVLRAAVEGNLTTDWRHAHTDTLESASVLVDRILLARREAWLRAELGKLEAQGKEASPAKVVSRYREPIAIESSGRPALPRGWVWTNLDALAYFTVDYRGKTPPEATRGIPVISAANVKDGRIVIEKPRFVSDDTYANWLKRGRPAGGDLIVTTEAPVGEVALYPYDGTYLLTRRVIAFQTLEVDNRYLLYAFRAEPTQQYLRLHSSGTTVPRILKPALLATPIPLPPLREQMRIVGEVEQRLSAADQLQHAICENRARSERLRQSILNRAFEGRLVLQDPSDEPASALLERIKPAREALAEERRRARAASGRRRGGTANRRGTHVSSTTELCALLQELQHASGSPVRVSDLIEASHLEIDSFHHLLKEATQEGRIHERREGHVVFLEAESENQEAVD
jgi:type I restriction enzyme S subunit